MLSSYVFNPFLLLLILFWCQNIIVKLLKGEMQLELWWLFCFFCCEAFPPVMFCFLIREIITVKQTVFVSLRLILVVEILFTMRVAGLYCYVTAMIKPI